MTSAISKIDMFQLHGMGQWFRWLGPWVIPQSPALNHTYKPVVRGRKIGFAKDEKAAAYGLILRSAVNLQAEPELLTSKVALALLLDLRRRDIDSGLKSLQDALQGHFYENDKQIKWLFVSEHGLKTTDTYLFIAPIE